MSNDDWEIECAKELPESGNPFEDFNSQSASGLEKGDGYSGTDPEIPKIQYIPHPILGPLAVHNSLTLYQNPEWAEVTMYLILIYYFYF